MTIRDVVFPPGRQALYEKNRYSPAVRTCAKCWCKFLVDRIRYFDRPNPAVTNSMSSSPVSS